MPLETSVTITDHVEAWLSALEIEMKRTLKIRVSKLWEQIKDSRVVTSIVQEAPQQVLSLFFMVQFTSMCEKAILSGKSVEEFKKIQTHLQKHLDEFTMFDFEALSDKTQRDVMELKIKSLILDIIYLLEIVKLLMKSSTSALSDWAWKKQIRFYLDQASDSCIIRTCDSEFFCIL